MSKHADVTAPAATNDDDHQLIRGVGLWGATTLNMSFDYPKVAMHRSPNVAMRQGDWKLLVNADGSNAELYDLANDRFETKNLATEKPDVTRRLAAAAIAWRKSLP